MEEVGDPGRMGMNRSDGGGDGGVQGRAQMASSCPVHLEERHGQGPTHWSVVLQRRDLTLAPFAV